MLNIITRVCSLALILSLCGPGCIPSGPDVPNPDEKGGPGGPSGGQPGGGQPGGGGEPGGGGQPGKKGPKIAKTEPDQADLGEVSGKYDNEFGSDVLITGIDFPRNQAGLNFSQIIRPGSCKIGNTLGEGRPCSIILSVIPDNPPATVTRRSVSILITLNFEKDGTPETGQLLIESDVLLGKSRE